MASDRRQRTSTEEEKQQKCIYIVMFISRYMYFEHWGICADAMGMLCMDAIEE
jgi:hypothetical protein